MENSSNRFVKKVNSVTSIALMLFIILLPIDSALSGFLGVSIIDVITLIVMFAILCIDNNKCKLRKLYKSDVFLLLFLAWDGVTIIWSKNSLYNSNLMFASYFVFFILIYFYNFSSNEDVSLTNAFYISIFVLLFTCIFFGEFKKGRFSIDINGIIDTNYLCTSFIVIIAVILYRLSNNKKIFLNIILLLAILLIVILSGSRGALMAISFEGIAYILFKYRRHFLKIIFLILIAFLIYRFFLAILPSKFSNRFDIINSIKTDGGSGRLFIWKNMLSFFNNGSLFNKIFGFGRESSRYLYKENIGIYYSPHNLYIKILIENGVIGVILFFIFFISKIYLFLKHNLRIEFAIFIGFFVGCLFLDMDNTRVFWIVLLLCSNSKFKISM